MRLLETWNSLVFGELKGQDADLGQDQTFEAWETVAQST